MDHHARYQEECEQQQFEQSLVVYCDYIAHIIKERMNASHPDNIICGAGSIKWDLGNNGEFVSTKKHLFVVDRNRRTYKITVEEI